MSVDNTSSILFHFTAFVTYRSKYFNNDSKINLKMVNVYEKSKIVDLWFRFNSSHYCFYLIQGIYKVVGYTLLNETIY